MADEQLKRKQGAGDNCSDSPPWVTCKVAKLSDSPPLEKPVPAVAVVEEESEEESDEDMPERSSIVKFHSRRALNKQEYLVIDHEALRRDLELALDNHFFFAIANARKRPQKTVYKSDRESMKQDVNHLLDSLFHMLVSQRFNHRRWDEDETELLFNDILTAFNSLICRAAELSRVAPKVTIRNCDHFSLSLTTVLVYALGDGPIRPEDSYRIARMLYTLRL